AINDLLAPYVVNAWAWVGVHALLFLHHKSFENAYLVPTLRVGTHSISSARVDGFSTLATYA
ncbi:MAG: hypothetical protein OQK32_05970, partial [Gammaproteobacteria bacterium]|nr:hypothetical protein [Gammaproteobacteria bacterium]